MKDKMLFLSDTTAAAGVGVGLANVYTILGIILIVLNIGIVTTKSGLESILTV